MKRSATAVWQGSGKDGKGILTTQSSVLNETQYSFSSRFENGIGTNPEELVAAAHAGCYSMFLSALISAEELSPKSIETNATVTLGKDDIVIANDGSYFGLACQYNGSGK